MFGELFGLLYRLFCSGTQGQNPNWYFSLSFMASSSKLLKVPNKGDEYTYIVTISTFCYPVQFTFTFPVIKQNTVPIFRFNLAAFLARTGVLRVYRPLLLRKIEKWLESFKIKK